MGNEPEASRAPHESVLRRFAAYFVHFYNSLLSRLQRFYNLITGLWQSVYHKLLEIVGPEHSGKPSSHTVVWTLFAFMIFLVFGSLAVKFPTHKVKNALVSINSIIVCALSVSVWRDFRGNPGEYRRNLGNSIFTVLFTMILLTVLYTIAWYHDLNLVVLQLQEDILNHPRFPAVAILQDTESDYQANIVNEQAPKCFSGVSKDGAPPCESLIAEQYMSQPSCSCNNSWSSNGNADFVWASIRSFKYFLLRPPHNMISKQPGYVMTLQVYFNYNASVTLGDVEIRPNPNLWLAVFDPASELEQALDSGYSPLNPIDANGMSSINLDLNLRQPLNETQINYYNPSISTIPYQNLVCDTSTNATGLCITTLYIQYTSSTRTITTQRRAMTWTDAAASAGAYFAFVQFLSWIVSGQVWAK